MQALSFIDFYKLKEKTGNKINERKTAPHSRGSKRYL